MIYRFNGSLIVLLFSIFCAHARSTFKIADMASIASLGPAPKVRVLLNEQPAAKGRFVLTCDHGFKLYDPESPQQKIDCASTKLVVSLQGPSLYLNKKKFLRSSICVLPKKGYLSFNAKHYAGSFCIMRFQEKMHLINVLDLEDYVCSVLRTESWPGWPLEVNKAFAIASRSYVIAMMLRAAKSKKPYHVKNTNAHQTYQGIHDCQIIHKAVAQTRGVFLGYDNKPILAMFDSCCGGIVPAKIEDFDFTDAPYLARNYACKHCKKCSLYDWQVEYDFHELARVLHQAAPTLKQVKEIKVTKKDKAGVVQEVTLKGLGAQPVTLSGNKVYSLLPEVKSFCFDVQKKSDKALLKGRGFGHHIGICQWGAREMVRDGWSYKRILDFYYPGTKHMKLS